jgi:hypothetical protein
MSSYEKLYQNFLTQQQNLKKDAEEKRYNDAIQLVANTLFRHVTNPKQLDQLLIDVGDFIKSKEHLLETASQLNNLGIKCQIRHVEPTQYDCAEYYISIDIK